MPVEKGNKIYVSADGITAKETTVNWQQSFSSRSQQYYVCEFVNKDQGDERGMIFIQKSFLDQFKSRSGNSDYTITVDDWFQYGQKDKNGTGRWLAFHDKSQKPYQWRFLENTVTKYSDWILKTFGDKIPIDIGILKNFFGDYLHSF
ncbi:Nn.00g039950.m01.CDS01 [Neocucurbitaria sp. VM-36]